MNTKKHIEELFSDYEKTLVLTEFMEEMESNLNDRIALLKNKGLNEDVALEKALIELGDISTLADELSLKRKQEVLSEMYMQTRNYISTKKGILYALCGLVLGTAILIPLIVWLATNGDIVGTVSTIFPFAMASILGFVYLGLTQETAVHEAMRPKRALLYVLAVGLVLFGILTGLIVLSTSSIVSIEELKAHSAINNSFLVGAIGPVLVFTLPGIALGAFLILTEKDRKKAWVKKLYEGNANPFDDPFGDSINAMRFGLISGAIWIAAIAGFILLTLTVGFKFSWLSIVAALIIQMLTMTLLIQKKK